MVIRLLVLGSFAMAGTSASAFEASSPAMAQTASAPKVAPKPAVAPPVTRATFAQRLDAQFRNIDADGNGTITRAELDTAQDRLNDQQTAAETKRGQERFSQLDANHDGQLSPAEFLAPIAKRKVIPDGAAAMTRLDTNKDGKITPAEYRAQPMANFDKIDANHDGSLSPTERAGAARK